MFRNTYQAGFLSVLYSVGSKPLQIWDKKVRNGHIKRLTDGDINSSCLEICGSNVSTTYITCPADPKKTLGVKLPFLVLMVKNLNKYFSFEVTVLDDKNVHRRFRASNYQSTTRVKPFICTMPLRLDPGWNQIQFNLADFTSRAYGTNYVETLRVQIHANCRIRRAYFADKLYSEAELPAEFRLVVPPEERRRRLGGSGIFVDPGAASASAEAGGEGGAGGGEGAGGEEIIAIDESGAAGGGASGDEAAAAAAGSSGEGGEAPPPAEGEAQPAEAPPAEAAPPAEEAPAPA